MNNYEIIPNFNKRYGINKNGEVFDFLTQRIVESWINTTRTKQYYRVNLYNELGKRKKFALHRLLALTFIENIDNKPFIDHINSDSLDNSLENLRWVTAKENSENRVCNSTNETGYIGVYYRKDKNMYVTQIAKKHVGYYASSELAAEAYNKKAIELGYLSRNIIKNNN